MKQKTKFKQTEIGMIPEEWEVEKIKNLFDIFVGGDAKKISVSKTKTAKFKYPIYSNSLRDKGLYGFSDNFRFPSNCVTITSRGEVGIAEYRSEPFNAIVRLIVLKPKTEVSSYFITNFINSKLDFQIVGSAVNQLTAPMISDFLVAVPPLPEQRAIAKILSDLDSKIELNQQMNKTLEEIGKAIFKHWFIDFEFPNEEGKPYKSSGGEMVYNDELGKEIPKGWKVKPVGEVVTVKGGSTPSTEKKEYWEDGTINWCTPKDLSSLSSAVLLDTERKITKAGLEIISSGLLEAGTLLLSSRAPIGYVAISEIPVSINQGFIAIICDKDLSNYYMFFWVKRNIDLIKSKAHGTTFQEINKASFRSIPILTPPRQVVAAFDRIAEFLHRKIVYNELGIRNLSQIRDLLLPKLMSGKIRVPIEVKA